MFKKKKKQIEIKHTHMSLGIAHATDSFFNVIISSCFLPYCTLFQHMPLIRLSGLQQRTSPDNSRIYECVARMRSP